MNRTTRRGVLASAVTIGVVTVSGCAAQPEDAFGDTPNGGTTDPGDTEDGTTDREGGTTETPPENVTDAPGIDDASIETLQTDCASPDDDGITVEGDGSTVVVDGVLPAPNPCHEAVLDGVTVADTTLSLVVDAADTTADDEACVMCQGAVSYRAEVKLADPPVESVTVDHATGGRHTGIPEHTKTTTTGHTKTTAPETPGLPTPVTDAAIETVDSRCRTDSEKPIAVAFGNDAVTITGTLLTANPCHEAVIESVTAEADHLSVAVGVRSTLQEDAGCVDCLGAISYEARIELAEQSGITAVAVDHTPGDGRTVTR
jgi:hypothetical protein